MTMRWIAPVMLTIAVTAGAAPNAQQILVTETPSVGEPLMMPPGSAVRGR